MRERQAAQLAAAFILKADRPVGVVRLMKLMYLAEREAIRRTGLPMVFDEIHAMREGMALSRTFDLMTARQGESKGDWARHIAPLSRAGLGVCQGVGESSLDGLSRGDLEIVNLVWAKHGQSNRDKLVHEVHHKLDEWLEHWDDPNRRRAAVPVPHDKLVQTIRRSVDGEVEKTPARADTAAELFREQALSLGRAARFAGMPLAEFMVNVSKRGIPAIRGDAGSVREDIAAVEAWREGSWPSMPVR